MGKWSRIKFSPCLPMGSDGRRITACKEHIELSRRAAGEGMVLLKNDGGLLPLNRGKKIAVFGKAQYDYVKGGGGSGDVTTEYVRNIYEGLKIKEAEGKISVYEGLIDFYKNEVEKQYARSFRANDEPETDIVLGMYDAVLEKGKTIEPDIPKELLKGAAAFTDTAVITICRNSKEGSDRSGEVGDGDFYLSAEEEKMVKTVTDNFKNIIVVINAGAQTDTEWYRENKKTGAVLYAWQGGMEGGLAVADALCGDINPSGKLVDTFAKHLSDYPFMEEFKKNDECVKYYEDIYVGYRYFETIPNAADKVAYPFGFGLSYTEFEITNVAAKMEGDKIRVRADVKNIGTLSGKEVVQVYYSAPRGKLGKPAFELAAFAKTKELAPGEGITVCREFDISSMASYDDVGKIKKSAYIIEKGSYKFFVGNSVRNTIKAEYEYIAENNIIVNQLTQQAAPSKLEKRMMSDGGFEKLYPEIGNTSQSSYIKNTAKAPGKKAMLIDVAEGRVTLDEFTAQLSDEQLVSLTYGKPNRGVANSFGMGDLKEYGVPNVMTCDGPAGLHLNEETGVSSTAFPCAVMLACTWNTDLMREIGEAAAKEIKENNLGIWLAPALNIHRNPLCGRNFEYYSEDPLISGAMAAANVEGVQSQHIAATAKHFCTNNKEENRFELDVVISERALREIYLKGFEICVKKSQPWLIMSSYSSVNGTRVSENRDILTNILRDEWGFEGMVTTDWGNNAEQFKELRAGNDMKMPQGQHKEVIAALKRGDITRAEIEACVKRILKMIMKID